MPRVLNFADKKRQAQYEEFRVFIDAYKIERGCIDCGWAEHPAALVLDHIDPKTKTIQVSCMYSCTKERQMQELALCEVRCANCHQIRTYELGHMGMRKTRIMPDGFVEDVSSGPFDKVVTVLKNLAASVSS